MAQTPIARVRQTETANQQCFFLYQHEIAERFQPCIVVSGLRFFGYFHTSKNGASRLRLRVALMWALRCLIDPSIMKRQIAGHMTS